MWNKAVRLYINDKGSTDAWLNAYKQIFEIRIPVVLTIMIVLVSYHKYLTDPRLKRVVSIT